MNPTIATLRARNAATLRAMRDENDGQLPSVAWPGAYPIAYYDADTADVACATCAGRWAMEGADIVADVYYEGPAMACADCGDYIPSAYGPGDDEDEDARYARFVAMADYRCDAWHRGTMATIATIGGRILRSGNDRGPVSPTYRRMMADAADDAMMASRHCYTYTAHRAPHDHTGTP